MEDEYGRPVPWVYESTITDPTGLKVHVKVTVPGTAFYFDSGECGEVVQMAATRAMTQITASRKAEQERCPF
jgi:hypothetical protein